MNSKALTDKIRKLSSKTNINNHLLLSNYFFETIIERIEKSKYKNILAIHGGYLLGLFFGIESRSTKDIDVSLEFNKIMFISIYKLNK